MKSITSLLFFLFTYCASAQMITGVWKGKVGSGLKATKLELKLVQRGDSLFGNSYYYESANSYRKFSVKGYFNQQTNQVIWWDEELLEAMVPKLRLLSSDQLPLLMEADFNCPGGGVMMLDGEAVTKEEQTKKGILHLDKVERPSFRDEWDFVIDNYLVGGNDPSIIDSIALVTKTKTSPIPPPVSSPDVAVQQPKQETPKQPITPTTVQEQKPEPSISKVNNTPIVKEEAPVLVASQPPPIQEKFIERKKVFTTELPLEGDTIELHFYDNAEIDGDSISLFLNNQLVFEHVRLTDKPYIVKFAVSELSETNELVMVAENLGSIPPNTSYMIAYVNNQRYTANLESTENTSAMIRFVRKQTPPKSD
jgi:hypothetical protein